MECRHLLAFAAAGLLLVAGARVHAGEPRGRVPSQRSDVARSHHHHPERDTESRHRGSQLHELPKPRTGQRACRRDEGGCLVLEVRHRAHADELEHRVEPGRAQKRPDRRERE